jgi:hypothetical protein
MANSCSKTELSNQFELMRQLSATLPSSCQQCALHNTGMKCNTDKSLNAEQTSATGAGSFQPGKITRVSAILTAGNDLRMRTKTVRCADAMQQQYTTRTAQCKTAQRLVQ